MRIRKKVKTAICIFLVVGTAFFLGCPMPFSKTDGQDFAPEAPTGLQAEADAVSISLNWTDNSDVETGYMLERSEVSGDYGSADVYTLPENSDTYNDTAVSGGVVYYYRVKAVNTFGDSDYSNEVSCRTSIFADHTILDKVPNSSIPNSAIELAKNSLHVAYGHSSHGGQLTQGLDRLNDFMEGKGADTGLYTVRFYGVATIGELDLYDRPWRRLLWDDYANDLGAAVIDGVEMVDYIAWMYTTRKYLGWIPEIGDGSDLSDYASGIPAYDPSGNNNCNVIMWAWCRQLSDSNDDVVINYLNNMDQLESDYPNVTFVYMTGHVDGTGDQGTLRRHNDMIRAFCQNHGKILYDFADIESYDPDGNYYDDKYVTDGCNYDANGDGVTEETDQASNDWWPATPLNGDRNWALDWQAAHVLDTDWYECDIQYYHTQHLNHNLKAYAAWWLFARIAGWDGE